MTEKNYVGSGFEKVFANGGSVINIRIKIDKLIASPDEDGFIKLVVGKKREATPGKPTHWVAEDTYRSGNEPEDTPPPPSERPPF